MNMAENEQQVSAPEEKSNLPSPGQVLRVAREGKGLSQQDIADKLFLKAAIIDNLENDVLDETTSVTFIKGYIKLYAKHVGVDEQTIIAQFDQRHAQPKSTTRLQSFSKSVTRQANDARWMMVTYVILALVVAGVVVWYIQQPSTPALIDESASQPSTQSSTQPPSQSPDQTASQSLTQQENSVAQESSTSQEPSASQVQSTLQEPSDDNSVDSSNEQSIQNLSSAADTGQQSSALQSTTQQTATQQTMAQTVTDEVASDANNNGDIELVFTFSEDCWVNIEDATGEAIAYGVKRAGRVMTIQGQPPFAVTLGNPTQVAITYAGEAIDLSGFDGGQIARFSLPIQD